MSRKIQTAISNFHKEGHLVGQNEDNIKQCAFELIEYVVLIILKEMNYSQPKQVWKMAVIETTEYKKNRTQPWFNVIQAIIIMLNIEKQRKNFIQKIIDNIYDITYGKDILSFLEDSTEVIKWSENKKIDLSTMYNTVPVQVIHKVQSSSKHKIKKRICPTFLG
jgi:hypothetical protein